MNTKQLLKMSQDDIEHLCNGNCETNQCPFKKSLRECREDGFCIKQTYHSIDRWIKEDKREIEDLENRIKKEVKIIKNRIKKYKQWKKKIEKELENE